MKQYLVALAVLALCASGASAELIVNGTFNNSANLVPVSTIVASASTVGKWQYLTGTWSVQASGGDPDGYALGHGAGNEAFAQVVPLPAGGTCSFNVKTDSAMWYDAYLMKEGDSFAAYYGTVPGNVAFDEGEVDTTNGQWTLVSKTIPANPSFSYLCLTFWTGANTGIDNVSVLPEPATMSVLGLGALALLRRRRA